MGYTKTSWNNNTAPYINADNLNKIENGIEEVNNAIGVDEYSNASTYLIGNYCMHENKMYRCLTIIATPEEFNSSHWEETSLEQETRKNINNIATNRNNITSINTTLDDMNEIDDFASKITFNETPVNYHMKAKNGIAFIDYNGQAKTHQQGNVLFTIPAGYRPTGDIFTPSIQGTTYARVWISGSNGVVQISSISNTTNQDRINFVISYLIGN